MHVGGTHCSPVGELSFHLSFLLSFFCILAAVFGVAFGKRMVRYQHLPSPWVTGGLDQLEGFILGYPCSFVCVCPARDCIASCLFLCVLADDHSWKNIGRFLSLANHFAWRVGPHMERCDTAQRTIHCPYKYHYPDILIAPSYTYVRNSLVSCKILGNENIAHHSRAAGPNPLFGPLSLTCSSAYVHDIAIHPLAAYSA